MYAGNYPVDYIKVNIYSAFVNICVSDYKLSYYACAKKNIQPTKFDIYSHNGTVPIAWSPHVVIPFNSMVSCDIRRRGFTTWVLFMITNIYIYIYVW